MCACVSMQVTSLGPFCLLLLAMTAAFMSALFLVRDSSLACSLVPRTAGAGFGARAGVGARAGTPSSWCPCAPVFALGAYRAVQAVTAVRQFVHPFVTASLGPKESEPLLPVAAGAGHGARGAKAGKTGKAGDGHYAATGIVA